MDLCADFTSNIVQNPQDNFSYPTMTLGNSVIGTSTAYHQSQCNNSRDLVLPSIFVSIPIHHNETQSCNQLTAKPFFRVSQSSREEVKDEPIKFEGSDSTVKIIHELTAASKSSHGTPPNLVTARPKASIQCYKCELCLFITISELALENHKSSCHSATSELPNNFNLRKIPCPGCANVFFTKHPLEAHLEYDHQMVKDEIPALIECLLETGSPSGSSGNRKSRIYLKSVDALRNPDFQENFIQPLPNLDCDSSSIFNDSENVDLEDNLIFIDLIHNDNEDMINNTHYIETQPTPPPPAPAPDTTQTPAPQNKIFIKNIEILREPYLQANSEILNDAEQQAYYDMSSGYANHLNFQSNDVIIGNSTASTVIQTLPDEEEVPCKANIFIKNVDILKEPLFLSPMNPPMNSEDLNFSIFSPTAEMGRSLTSTPEEICITPDIQPFQSNLPSMLSNTERYPSDIASFQPKKPSNSLHLRTVDELNLMNMNEVQNLIAPNLDQEIIPLSSENSKNSDEINPQNKGQSLPEFMYTVNSSSDNFVSEGNGATLISQGAWNNDYNFVNLNNLDSNSPSMSSNTISPLHHSHLELNTPIRIENDDTQENIIGMEMETPLVSSQENYFLTENHSNGMYESFNENLTQQEIVEIQDDQAEGVSKDDSLCAEAQNVLEKGRIYVAENLVDDKNQQPLESKRSRGRPAGSKNNITLSLRYSGGLRDHTDFKCEVDGCSMRFRNLENLCYHKKCHSIFSPTKYVCPECQRSDFSSWNTLHTHLWRAHLIDMELYKCEHCSFKTPSLSRLLNTHIKIHSDERNFTCSECDKAFKNARQLKNHRRLHRLRSDPEMEESENAPAHKRTVKENISSKECSDSETFKCSVCDKVLSSKSYLKLHLLTHEAATSRFRCDICQYTTNDHNGFRRHRKIHKKDLNWYECPFCGYRCVQSNLYQKHLQRKHPELVSQVLFQCSHCSFATINRRNAIRHNAKHKTLPDDTTPPEESYRIDLSKENLFNSNIDGSDGALESSKEQTSVSESNIRKSVNQKAPILEIKFKLEVL